MESTLRLWKVMETESNVQGNEVTFNLLFDVASKAGNFVLAERIYQEMQDRGIAFNRYHHVSLIHYFGLKLDSGGIRAAYQEMVSAGELVDTIVLNCVIAGLLRCGEDPEAEETYQRMKDGHADAPTRPPQHYNTNKIVTKVLMMFSRVGRQYPGMQKTMQDGMIITPDLRTYRIMIEHFAIRVGNLKKVAQYLDEMKHLKIQLHPTIFLALFKGFYLHGGFNGSDWSERRLEGVLAALYAAHDEHGQNFRIERWVIIWALRALHRCCPIEVVTGAYADLSSRWSVEPESEEFMDAFYANLVNGKDRSSLLGMHGSDGSRV
jgi:pentatricopeptide repeat protein